MQPAAPHPACCARPHSTQTRAGASEAIGATHRAHRGPAGDAGAAWPVGAMRLQRHGSMRAAEGERRGCRACVCVCVCV